MACGVHPSTWKIKVVSCLLFASVSWLIGFMDRLPKLSVLKLFRVGLGKFATGPLICNVANFLLWILKSSKVVSRLKL